MTIRDSAVVDHGEAGVCGRIGLVSPAHAPARCRISLILTSDTMPEPGTLSGAHFQFFGVSRHSSLVPAVRRIDLTDQGLKFVDRVHFVSFVHRGLPRQVQSQPVIVCGHFPQQ